MDRAPSASLGCAVAVQSEVVNIDPVIPLRSAGVPYEVAIHPRGKPQHGSTASSCQFDITGQTPGLRYVDGGFSQQDSQRANILHKRIRIADLAAGKRKRVTSASFWY